MTVALPLGVVNRLVHFTKDRKKMEWGGMDIVEAERIKYWSVLRKNEGGRALVHFIFLAYKWHKIC